MSRHSPSSASPCGCACSLARTRPAFAPAGSFRNPDFLNRGTHKTRSPSNPVRLNECWRPAVARYLYLAFTALRRELDTYLRYYNTDRVHHGRLTRGRIPADIVYGARKMEAR
jgi:hypothetical protein